MALGELGGGGCGRCFGFVETGGRREWMVWISRAGLRLWFLQEVFVFFLFFPPFAFLFLTGA